MGGNRALAAVAALALAGVFYGDVISARRQSPPAARPGDASGVTQSFVVNPPTGAPGGTVTVVKTVTATSDCADLVNDTAVLNDPLGRPAGILTALSTSPSSIQCTNNGGALVSCDSTSAMSSFVITFQVAIPNPAPAYLTLIDIVYFGSKCSDTSSVKIPIGGSPPTMTPTPTPTPSGPLLRITKRCDQSVDTVYQRSSFAYVIEVTNVGNAPAGGDTVVTDLVPSQLGVSERYATLTHGTKVDVLNNECTQASTDLGILVTCTHTGIIDVGWTWRNYIYVYVTSGKSETFSNTAFLIKGDDPGPLPKPSNAVTLANAVKPPPSPCVPSQEKACIGKSASGGAKSPAAYGAYSAEAGSGRFGVRVFWYALRQGTSGNGQAVPITSDTASFWFFSPNNLELVIKVVDGTAVNGKFWVFYGALTNVAYIIEIVDGETGAVQSYFNPLDVQASNADTGAFSSTARTSTSGSEFEFIPTTIATAPDPPRVAFRQPVEEAVSGACVADTTTLCENGARFQVKVHWEALHQGTSGEGQAVPITSDTGYFWFFSPNNIELVVKVVDGRAVNGKFWVFYGALSNVQYTITITDTLTGTVKTYFNPQDTQASAADTSAF